MFGQILNRIRERVRARQYIVTLHAAEEMDDDGFSMSDVEHAILTGSIRERQKDRDTGESKYRLVGHVLNNRRIEVVAKLSITGKLVIITAYEL